MINRRKFLEAGAAVGVGAMIPVKVAEAAEKMARSRAGSALASGGSPPLAKWQREVPNALDPGFIYKPTIVGGVKYYDIPIQAAKWSVHPDLPDTYFWTYGGTFPSRTIETMVGEKIRIRWNNKLKPSDAHPVAAAIDYKYINGMAPAQVWSPNGPTNPYPVQRIATHLHGGHVPWTTDGGPLAWYTGPFFGPSGNSVQHANDGYNLGDTFDYPNAQFASTLWFHDHAEGITRLNVYAGLAGFYILRHPDEGSVSGKKKGRLGLPFGKYEIPLAIQDRTFNPLSSDPLVSGQLSYPPPPEVPEFFGDTMLVNGQVWPFCTVEPRRYRLRLLNGCNARFLRMQLVLSDAAGSIPSTTRAWTNVPFVQIGAEGGFFNNATAPFNTLLMAPAERADVIIDFSAVPQTNGVGYVLLYNDASTPFGNTADTRGAIPQVLLFKVTGGVTDSSNNGDPANYSLPQDFTKIVSDALATTPSNQWGFGQPKLKELDEITYTYPDKTKMLMQLINRFGFMNNPTGSCGSDQSCFVPPGPIVAPDQVTLGTTEIWEIINTTVDVHPIHLHQTMFQVVNRQPFNVGNYVAQSANGPIDPSPFLSKDQIALAGPNEQGWKDTVRANPGEVTRIAIQWDDTGLPDATQSPLRGGNYVYHCHILEHEEHDMMRALFINPKTSV